MMAAQPITKIKEKRSKQIISCLLCRFSKVCFMSIKQFVSLCQKLSLLEPMLAPLFFATFPAPNGDRLKLTADRTCASHERVCSCVSVFACQFVSAWAHGRPAGARLVCAPFAFTGRVIGSFVPTPACLCEAERGDDSGPPSPPPRPFDSSPSHPGNKRRPLD